MRRGGEPHRPACCPLGAVRGAGRSRWSTSSTTSALWEGLLGQRSGRCQTRFIDTRGAHPDEWLAIIDRMLISISYTDQLADQQPLDTFSERPTVELHGVDAV